MIIFAACKKMQKHGDNILKQNLFKSIKGKGMNSNNNGNNGETQNLQNLPVRQNPNPPSAQPKRSNPNLPSPQKQSERAVKPGNPAKPPPQALNKRPPNSANPKAVPRVGVSGGVPNISDVPDSQRSSQVRPAQARPAYNPSSDSRQGDTAVFDCGKPARQHQRQQGDASQSKKPSSPPSRSRTQADDGVYNYTGRNIRSNRQKFVSTDDDIAVSKNRNSKGRKDRRARDDVEVSDKRGGSGLMSGVLKAVLYILGVVIISVFLAYHIVMIVNDVFAFVKDEAEVEITLPDGADIYSISRILADNNLIRYPFFFRLYGSLRGRNSEWEFRDGEPITVSAAMGYDEFIRSFRTRPPPRATIRITFQEGMTIDDMIDRFVENNMGTRERFEYVINNHRFPHEFLQPLYEAYDNGELSPYRRFILEGYLFPDTYEFFTDDSEENIIVRFLNNFERRFDRRFFDRLNILNMSLDEIVNLAAIIQREARHAVDFSRVSAVFHNRLLSPEFPFLQSDATIMYDRNLFPYHREVTGADLLIDVPFNTYTRPGLPPSAIGNPGINAIHAALEPNEAYLRYYFFFVSRPDGYTLYARTHAQHINNINIARAWAEEQAALAEQSDGQ